MRIAGLALLCTVGLTLEVTAQGATVSYFPLGRDDYPHDVAAAPDGKVWFAGQKRGIAGLLDPTTGKIERISLGQRAAPHGVIIGPDGAPWFTEGGQNAIARLDPVTKAVKLWPLPADRQPYVNLNTAVFDLKGRIWFTGQNGVYGRLDPGSGDIKVWNAPKGPGAYGITVTPTGDIWFVSLASSYLAKVDIETGAATVFEPPTPRSGQRRVWSDSRGKLWISEWNSGHVTRFDPEARQWHTWKLPGTRPRAYSVYVDWRDKVWLTDWGANAIVQLDPVTEKFESYPSDRPNANVRQMHGRNDPCKANHGVWAGESGTDRIVRIVTPASSGEIRFSGSACF